MSWTDEKVNKLKDLWAKGHTASQIAAELGDTTRNAVIGKAHRLKLAARAASKGSTNTRKQSVSSSEVKNEKFVSRKAKFKIATAIFNWFCSISVYWRVFKH